MSSSVPYVMGREKSLAPSRGNLHESLPSPVPTYRVYYAERMPQGARDWMRMYGLRRGGEEAEEARHREIEWEEEVEARSATEALDAFFREHAQDRTQVMWVDEAGESHELQGLEDYDPEKTYIWIEDDKLM